MIWANLVHLSYNMWMDRETDLGRHLSATGYLRFDEALWNDLLVEMRDAGLNMVVLDLGDAVLYESHPEIAVQGAWDADKLRAELQKCREFGLTPIPKLNFSTTHDAWLGPYARMVSSPAYYQVCRDLIDEVCRLFDSPQLFHIGMDEETPEHQSYFAYAVMRQHELWWHDFLFLVDQVERNGARAWIWSDYIWTHPDTFLKNMPKSVLQSNWYYDPDFPVDRTAVKAYLDLDSNGFEQVPAGSNHSSDENFGNTVQFCSRHLAPERLQGFLQTVWRPTIEEMRSRQIQAVRQVGAARRSLEDTC